MFQKLVQAVKEFSKLVDALVRFVVALDAHPGGALCFIVVILSVGWSIAVARG